MDSQHRAHSLVDRAQILKHAASIGVLGAGAHGAPQIMAALCNSEVDARVVGTLLRKEPALCARVLRVANSPYYGQSRSITTLDRALVVLGLDAVRGIAAAACLDRTMSPGSEQSLVDMEALLQHSLATASAAETLARIQNPALACDAFIAGLLHNLGIVVQLHLDSPGITTMIDLRKSDDTRDMRALESEYASVGHEECIAVIFEAWKLPESLIVATRHHHDPMAAIEPHRALAALINLGATLGLASGSTFTLEPAPIARNAAAMSWLGLNEEQVDEVAIALPGRVAELRQTLVDA
ncbi:MAG: HDOD domain-containing protein [Steroidobacteraceae bacterium]